MVRRLSEFEVDPEDFVKRVDDATTSGWLAVRLWGCRLGLLLFPVAIGVAAMVESTPPSSSALPAMLVVLAPLAVAWTLGMLFALFPMAHRGTVAVEPSTLFATTIRGAQEMDLRGASARRWVVPNAHGANERIWSVRAGRRWLLVPESAFVTGPHLARNGALVRATRYLGDLAMGCLPLLTMFALMACGALGILLVLPA